MKKQSGENLVKKQKPFVGGHFVVKNAKGTSKRKKCRGWLKYWREKTGFGPTTVKCCYKGCSDSAKDGAHVFIVNNNLLAGKQFIVPFCHFHNFQDECIELDQGTYLVSDAKRGEKPIILKNTSQMNGDEVIFKMLSVTLQFALNLIL